MIYMYIYMYIVFPRIVHVITDIVFPRKDATLE